MLSISSDLGVPHIALLIGTRNNGPLRSFSNVAKFLLQQLCITSEQDTPSVLHQCLHPLNKQATTLCRCNPAPKLGPQAGVSTISCAAAWGTLDKPGNSAALDVFFTSSKSEQKMDEKQPTHTTSRTGLYAVLGVLPLCMH
mmetsp:Transcript_131449/g.227646  ORF Transcript_131449/g.227646 Transcript_131449/m.227646 type:complete len:141 (+) Transcript_131449:1481-1903(+)